MFGPLALFARFPERLEVITIGPHAQAVRSSQGTEVVAAAAPGDVPDPDIVLVPGGLGTRSLVRDAEYLGWLREWAGSAALVTSVCTGSGLLAAAGLLDGYRATSNKRAVDWARSQGPGVTWVARARWVHDRDRWTSSGVAAGMDMAAALLGDLFGAEEAERAANEIELDLHRDPDRDPFAAIFGH